MHVTVKNESKGVVLASQTKVARSILARTIGLLGHVQLKPGEGMWITPCTSVHTFFMRFAIDVAFVGRDGVVISQATLAPWMFSPWERSAAGALELSAGTLRQTNTEVGDRITFNPI
jgi:uncharacterized protein